ncbi:MAG TPA: FKBP-type peptidyl-prolyl cis-trans isomerase [Rudaea sp.]|jgi:FKBP-type peptidyl-prolyl cis-trans isomerase|nr:FKBP-type peptidyl-prolyl cis-trans isomerase [Rudaea sp.]
MSKFLRKTVTAVAIATAFAGAGMASAADQKPAGNPAMAAPGMAAKPAADTSAIDAKFKGDKKAEYSYMVGMDVARGLQTIKDEVDMNVMIQALQTALKGGPTTITEGEALTVRQEFVQKLQARQAAKTKEEAEKNQKEGDDFLAKTKTKKSVKTTASGLEYEVVKEGSGPKPKATDSVKVEYTGTKIDGTKFDATADHNPPGPATFPLNGVIPGWTEGMQLMPVGSEYKFYVPAALAYKDRGPPAIGPNATLIFDVKLLSIEEPKAAGAATPAKPTIVPPKPGAQH